MRQTTARTTSGSILLYFLVIRLIRIYILLLEYYIFYEKFS